MISSLIVCGSDGVDDVAAIGLETTKASWMSEREKRKVWFAVVLFVLGFVCEWPNEGPESLRPHERGWKGEGGKEEERGRMWNEMWG